MDVLTRVHQELEDHKATQASLGQRCDTVIQLKDIFYLQ